MANTIVFEGKLENNFTPTLSKNLWKYFWEIEKKKKYCNNERRWCAVAGSNFNSPDVKCKSESLLAADGIVRNGCCCAGWYWATLSPENRQRRLVNRVSSFSSLIKPFFNLSRSHFENNYCTCFPRLKIVGFTNKRIELIRNKVHEFRNYTSRSYCVARWWRTWGGYLRALTKMCSEKFESFFSWFFKIPNRTKDSETNVVFDWDIHSLFLLFVYVSYLLAFVGANLSHYEV